MRKIFLVIILILGISLYFVYETNHYYQIHSNNSKEVTKITPLRAGGGTSSGSSSSGGSGSHSTTHNNTNSNESRGILSDIINLITIIVVAFFSSIILYLKIIRSSINSRHYLKLLKKKDPVWNYKEIEKQVIKTYYILQEDWTNQDLTNSKEYMDKKLYEKFESKLSWMDVGNRKNILKRIKLIDLKPVSIYDDEDNEQDIIWFYILGSMIDYEEDTKTHEIIKGSKVFPTIFTEYWQFRRTKQDKWVLSKIYQKEDADKIVN